MIQAGWPESDAPMPASILKLLLFKLDCLAKNDECRRQSLRF
jgi:hypothetical protein